MSQQKIGLTGGIGSGKSTVSAMFAHLGARIIDADEIAHMIIESDQAGYSPLIHNFGTTILSPDGEIDRKKLRSIVFHDPEKRKLINRLLHPLVRTEMDNQFNHFLSQDPQNVIIHDVPLLIETGLYQKMEVVILVYVDRNTQISRLARRDNLSNQEADRLLSIQMPIEEKKIYATAIINNSRTKNETLEEVKTLYHKLKQV